MSRPVGFDERRIKLRKPPELGLAFTRFVPSTRVNYVCSPQPDVQKEDSRARISSSHSRRRCHVPGDTVCGLKSGGGIQHKEMRRPALRSYVEGL